MVCEGDSLTGLGEAVAFITSKLLWTEDDRCSWTQSIHVLRSSGLPVGFIKYIEPDESFKTLPPKCFTLPKPTSNFLLKSVRYSAAKLWNGLPNEVRAKQSLAAFKKGLKKVQI